MLLRPSKGSNVQRLGCGKTRIKSGKRFNFREYYQIKFDRGHGLI